MVSLTSVLSDLVLAAIDASADFNFLYVRMEDNLCSPELDKLFLLEITGDLSEKERDEEDVIWLCLMIHTAVSCAYLDVTIHFAFASSSCKCCTELFPSPE